ncbi:translation initiation factor SUI1 [Poseidonibacter antarcticus]|uniref:translation initiation factor SUI1 n=1 Tax=Poseidonibacter antarcticus TaxID=2478538 RepID=UPI000EF53A1C|nr:translation initiation factor SUI1 [Poseidonibacter antarcticus]
MIFEMGAKLDGDNHDTSKYDEKPKKQKPSYKNNKNNKPTAPSTFNKNEILPKEQHQLIFTYEKRKGKPVTLVGRFSLSVEDKKEVLKLLKKKLACGGAIKDEWIELQGDVKEKIITILQGDGWKFRK